MKNVIAFWTRVITFVITMYVLTQYYGISAKTYLLVAITHIIWGVCGAVERK